MAYEVGGEHQRDRGRRAVVHVPDAERREEVACDDGERVAVRPLGLRALHDHAAELHAVAGRRARGVEVARVDLLHRAHRVDEEVAARKQREARLHQAAPVGHRAGVEVDVGVARDEAGGRGGEDGGLVAVVQDELLRPHVHEAVELELGLLELRLEQRRRGGLLLAGGALPGELRLEGLHALLQIGLPHGEDARGRRDLIGSLEQDGERQQRHRHGATTRWLRMRATTRTLAPTLSSGT
jgi:hypothetical protein